MCECIKILSSEIHASGDDEFWSFLNTPYSLLQVVGGAQIDLWSMNNFIIEYAIVTVEVIVSLILPLMLCMGDIWKSEYNIDKVSIIGVLV